MEINIRRLSPDVPMPEYKTPGACGFDIASIEEVTLQPGERKKIRTGLVVQVPDGHVLLLFPRGSNAKKGIRIANGTGVVDMDYCGPEDEIFAFMHNFGQEAYKIEKGERVVQGVIVPIVRPKFVDGEMNAKNRGALGTTG
ncbi:MAG: dUTP diphosphatase [Patescibacteria group bacterium]|jgi:dUTP pyrophosphatase